MPDLTAATFVTRDPGVYSGTLLGTAAGTTTVSAEPCFLAGFNFPSRVAGSSIIVMDSNGTSTNVLGTFTMGTQTFSDTPPTTFLNIAMKNGLTVVNQAGVAVLILFK